MILKHITSPELVLSSCVRQHTKDVPVHRVLPSVTYFNAVVHFPLFLCLLDFCSAYCDLDNGLLANLKWANEFHNRMNFDCRTLFATVDAA